MEHIIITPLSDGLLRLAPEAGYLLHNDITNRNYSEAITSSTDGFWAVLSGISPEPHERTLADAKAEKQAALKAYDASPAVNSFSLGGKPIWIAPEERANYILTLQGAQRLGVETVSFLGQTIPVATALQMLDAVNIYAMRCVAVTNGHAETINAKRSIQTVDAYDFKTGYPEKLSF